MTRLNDFSLARRQGDQEPNRFDVTSANRKRPCWWQTDRKPFHDNCLLKLV
jgi:hypothetical protein